MSLQSDWFAIRVKANREKVAAQSISSKGMETCLPVYQVESHKTRGVQVLQVPLFPGYLFARFNPHDRLPILMVPGVVGIVGFGNVPQPVDPDEMASVLALVGSDLRVMPHEYLPIGQRIRVQSGPLRGVEGQIVEHRDSNRLVVSITLLQRSIAVNIERKWLLPVRMSA